MSATIKAVALIYIIILAGIIFLADTHGTNFFIFFEYVPFGDKVGHFFLMGGFSLLLNLMLCAKTIRVWRIQYLKGSLIVGCVVTIEEFSQIFIRGRTFDTTDLIADYAGIIIFGEAARFICRKLLKL